MIQFKKEILVLGINAAWMFVTSAFANPVVPTLQIGQQSVVLEPGQTVRVPLLSNVSASGDLIANGVFQNGDVTFTDGPECHLSAHDCTLWVTAAPTSRDYTAVPVVVSESAVTNTPVFAVSVVHPGEPIPRDTRLPPMVSTPVTLATKEGSGVMFPVQNTTSHIMTNVMAFGLPSGVTSSLCSMIAPGATCTLRLAVNHTPQAGHYVISIQSDQGLLVDRILAVVSPSLPAAPAPIVSHAPAPLQRSGNALFYGVAEPHPGMLAIGQQQTVNGFTAATNGPVYQIVAVTNHDVTQPLSVAITGSDASSFSIDHETADYGENQNCAAMTDIASGDACLVIVKGKIGDPSQAPKTATLTIQGQQGNVATFTLTDTTYVYAAGGFNTLGNASVSGGDLLAQCTAGTCSNALQGTTGNNYATTSFSVGQWINALSVTSAGNLMVGGVFGAIGGATSGASSGYAALLAQCTPGPKEGDGCINQIGIGTLNLYAFSNAYIDGITPPQSTNFMYLGGDFANIRAFSVTAGQKMLAKCYYNGTSSSANCNNYMPTSERPNTKFANNAISAVDYFGSKVNVGGLFTQIAGYPSSAPGSGTTFASCTTSACSQGMGANNPNNSILGMTDDGASLYMGGAFTQIGGYTDSIGGYPLVSCTLADTTTCSNALADTNDANGYIEGLTYSGGSLYVGGRFTTIGGATAVSSGNMLAVCTPEGTCSNFVTDTNPYATGTDWGGAITAVAVGAQTSITAN